MPRVPFRVIATKRIRAVKQLGRGTEGRVFEVRLESNDGRTETKAAKLFDRRSDPKKIVPRGYKDPAYQYTIIRELKKLVEQKGLKLRLPPEVRLFRRKNGKILSSKRFFRILQNYLFFNVSNLFEIACDKCAF